MNKRVRKKNAISICLTCNKTFDCYSFQDRKYCDIKCQSIHSKLKTNEKIENGENVNPTRVRRYLIEKFGEKCMLCGWDKKNPITNKSPLDLDHVDGNAENNKLENLRIICPNCHSLTPTYKNLNKGKGRKNRRDIYQKGIKTLTL